VTTAEPEPGDSGAPKRRRTLLWLVSILAAVVVLCCAGGVTVLIRSVRTSSAAQRFPGNQAPADLPGPGEPVRDGTFEFTVQGFQCGQSELVEDGRSVRPEGQFCVVRLRVQNLADGAKTYFSNYQVGLAADGATFDSDLAATTLLVVGRGEQNSTNIEPGASITTTVVYDIPTGTTLAALELHDSPYSTGILTRTT
jgi:hypothetical protein